MILGISYCSVAEKQEDQEAASNASKNAPCDSVEQTMYDEHGNTYQVKMPCDTSKRGPSSLGDTVIRVN